MQVGTKAGVSESKENWIVFEQKTEKTGGENGPHCHILSFCFTLKVACKTNICKNLWPTSEQKLLAFFTRRKKGNEKAKNCKANLFSE